MLLKLWKVKPQIRGDGCIPVCWVTAELIFPPSDITVDVHAYNTCNHSLQVCVYNRDYV